jgi:hypothetical protein
MIYMVRAAQQRHSAAKPPLPLTLCHLCESGCIPHSHTRDATRMAPTTLLPHARDCNRTRRKRQRGTHNHRLMYTAAAQPAHNLLQARGSEHTCAAGRSADQPAEQQARGQASRPAVVHHQSTPAQIQAPFRAGNTTVLLCTPCCACTQGTSTINTQHAQPVRALVIKGPPLN